MTQKVEKIKVPLPEGVEDTPEIREKIMRMLQEESIAHHHKELEDEVRKSLDTDTNYPSGETDAMKWAIAWRLIREKNAIDINDDGWMAGWFDYCMASSPYKEDIFIKELSKQQLDHMVNRFLSWKIPSTFSPDAGISFKAEFNEHTDHPMRHEPTGTNLFNYTETMDMVLHMIEGVLEVSQSQEKTEEIDVRRDLYQRLSLNNHIQQLTAAILNYQNWDEATDYRQSGLEDKERERVHGLITKTLTSVSNEEYKRGVESAYQSALGTNADLCSSAHQAARTILSAIVGLIDPKRADVLIGKYYKQPAIVNKPVVNVEISKVCPACSEGTMECKSDVALLTNPLKYPHQCSSCGYAENYTEMYPKYPNYSTIKFYEKVEK